jgi:hypothetical protein
MMDAETTGLSHGHNHFPTLCTQWSRIGGHTKQIDSYLMAILYPI